MCPETVMTGKKLVTIFILLHVTLDISHQENRDNDEPAPKPSSLIFTPEASLQNAQEGLDDRSQQHGKPYHAKLFNADFRPCGDERLCWCRGNFASCSGQNLTRIPPGLPANITCLDFSYNKLSYVDQFMFRNFTSLESLNLHANNISSVSPEAFASLKGLTRLRVSGNCLIDFSGLSSALRHTQLKHLNASDNLFQEVSLTALLNVSALEVLHISGNNLTSISKGQRRYHGALQILDISSSLLYSFPDFCSRESQGQSFLPHLHTLNIEWNIITIMPPEAAKCLPSLKKLNLGGNAIRHIQRNFLQGFLGLETLILKFCMSKIIDSHAFNHSSLKYLDVSENLWFFDSHYGSGINPGLFQDLPQLQFLNMSWTVFRFSTPDERQFILSSVKHVKELILRGTGLDFIPAEILQEFTSLTLLSFRSNVVPFLADNTFENLTSLTTLDLQQNHLTTVSQELLGEIMSRPNASIDLSENPFACTCDLLWFIQKYQEDYQRKEGPRVFLGRTYKCKSPDSMLNIDLAKVEITSQKCALDQGVYLVILFVTCFILVLLVVGSIFYRYRWQLRFMLYSLQHRLSRNDGRPVPEQVYDIFVSYDSSESNWVTTVLIPELEGRRGLRLCVHERDFTPGMFITHNIIEKMEESAAIMPLLTRSFLTSEWCRFELLMAFKNAVRNRSRSIVARASDSADAAEPTHNRRIAIVPVLLDELQQEEIDSLLCAVLNTTTYLAWPGKREGRGESRNIPWDREREREVERFWSTLCYVVEKQGVGRRRGAEGGGIISREKQDQGAEEGRA